MGMSSSQARMLTLTARMHDIEYKAQRIEAQKLQLANDSDRAYEDYLDALDKKKFMAKVMGRDCTMQEVPFTANTVYSYKLLNEQFVLKTADGKALIPSSLHNAYQNTNSLSEFLTSFGLDSSYSQTIHHEDPNPAYTSGYQQYQNALDDYNTRRQQFLDRLERWEHQEIPTWQAEEPDPEDQKYWKVEEDNTLAEKFRTAGGSCYNSALNGRSECYAHVLAHIIDYTPDKGYSTTGNYYNNSWYSNTSDYNHNLYRLSNGGDVSISSGKITGAGMHNSSNCATMSEVSAKIQDESVCVAVDTNDACDIAVTNSSSDWDKLISKRKVDGSLKSMKQWAVDLYYLCLNYSTMGKTESDITTTIQVFQSNLEYNLKEFKQTLFDSDTTTWINSKPPKPEWTETPPKKEDYVGGVSPTVPRDEVVDHATFTDASLAQWYINLWMKMEGEDDTPKVHEEIVHNDATGEDKSVYSVDSKPKSSTTYGNEAISGAVENENYIVIDDSMLNDPNWVYNTISEGFVLIQQYDATQNKFVDTSVSVTTRISEVSDEEGLKKAEAKYEADMRAINMKDRKYDTELAACETERSAIKEELDTLKNVAKDNVDRTFKLFS